MVMRRYSAFTLIELIVVMGILAILATIVVIAVNPARQFSASRNAKRNSDTRAIAQALNQHAADNNGQIFSSVTTTPKIVGTTVGASYVDLTATLVPNYLSEIPRDPSGGTAADTGYRVYITGSNRVVAIALNAELDRAINSEGANYAIQFDGVNDNVTASVPIGATTTIEMWATWSGTDGIMLWRTGPGGAGPDLFFYGGLISLNTWNGSANSFGAIPGTAANGQYHHYVAVISSGYTALYYDGALLGTATYANPSSSSLTISSGVGSYEWSGKVDDVRVYNRVLSAGEVTDRYRGTAITDGLIGKWQYNEGGGTTTVDKSGNNYTATLTNGATWVTGR